MEWNRKALEDMVIVYYADHMGQDEEDLREMMEGMSDDELAKRLRRTYDDDNELFMSVYRDTVESLKAGG